MGYNFLRILGVGQGGGGGREGKRKAEGGGV